MKKSVFILIALLTFGINFNTEAQQSNLSAKEQRKLDKQQEKASKNEKAQHDYELYNKLVKDSTFVFTASNWNDARRGTVIIDPTINFLVVKKNKAFFQFGLDNVGPGFNGMGGASIDGRVVSYKYYKGKNSKKSSQLVLTIKSNYLHGTITFVMTFFGESATVDLSAGNNQRITLEGALFPLDKVNMMGAGSKF